MKENVTYVVGDPHLKEHYKGSEEIFRTDGEKVSVLLKAFDLLVDKLTSISTKKDNLVILGDVFDKPNVTPGFLQKISKRFVKLGNHFDRIDIISGNHDESEYSKYSAVESLKVLPNIFVHSKYSGYEPPFYPYDKDLKKIENLGFPANFSHNYHHKVFTDEFVEVDKGAGLVLVGHYHDSMKVGENIVYVGTPYPINKAELHNNRVLKLDDSGSYTEVSTNDLLNWITLDASDVNFKKDLRGLTKHYKIIMLEVYNVESDVALNSDLEEFKDVVYCYKKSKLSITNDIEDSEDSRSVLYDLPSIVDQVIEDEKIGNSIKEEVSKKLKQLVLE